MTSQIGARELIDLVVDPGTWQSWDSPPVHGPIPDDYADSLARAAERSGSDESVLTGHAEIGGCSVALIVSEFRFLGGSIGRAAARRIEMATRRATAAGIPIVAAPASGGTRMQEGTPAFVTIVDIARAIGIHKRMGLPYLVYLRHPTTGGVLASWGSLGDLTVAEPGALIGFLGPMVVEAVTGSRLPDHVQRAEHLADHGMFDALVSPTELGAYLATVLHILGDRGPAAELSAQPFAPTAPAKRDIADAWTSIELSRRDDRPGVRELLRYGTDRVAPWTRMSTDRGILCTLASFGGMSCVVVAQDRAAQTPERPMGPADLRLARRGMQMADRLGLPLVCVIDTPGADLSAEAEEGAIAGEIARTIATLEHTAVPSVTVVLGQGCGGGALALLPSRRVIVAEHGWLSPLPPEGASRIMHGTTAQAAEMARRQRVRAWDLLADGIAHALVPERTPAHADPEQFCRRVADEIVRQLSGGSCAARSCKPTRATSVYTSQAHRAERGSP